MNVKRFFSRRRHDAEVTQEIQSHIAAETAENVARGMATEEARRRAYLKFGNPQRVRETVWTENTLMWLDGLWRDLKYAVRTLGRSPGFSVMSVFVMALGIGGTVAMFSVVRNVLLTPLPYPDSKQLVTLWEHETGQQFGSYLPVDAGSFTEWKQATGGKAELALISPWQSYNVSAEGGKLPEKIDAGWCSWNFFHVLGIHLAVGRDFTAEDDRSDAPSTVILSHGFWMRRYSGNPDVVGKNVYLDSRPYTVIGVLPESFTFSSSMSSNTLQVWTAVSHEAPPSLMKEYGDHEFIGVARLLNGTTLAQLTSELGVLQKRIRAAHPEPAVHPMVNTRSLLDDAVEAYKAPLYVMLAATGCVLLIACLNVASLLVARVSARSKEHAIRAALGGSRWRLLRERITESFALSAAGGGLGLLLAWAALRWLVLTRPDIHRVETVHIDLPSVGFTVATVVLAAIFSALLSSWSGDRKEILTSLQESSRTHSAGGTRATLRRALLAAEVGLTVVLLVGAGLLLKSYQHLRSTDLGVPTDNVLMLSISLPDARYDAEKSAEFFERLITRVRTLPGVKAAAIVSRAPGQGYGGDNLLEVVEHPPLPKGVGLDVQRRGADPGYFAAMQIPILEGRTFRDDERVKHANVAILSAAGAKLLFPNEDPIGKHLKTDSDSPPYEIIGVVGDTRWRITMPPMATWYMPVYDGRLTNETVVLRASGNVESFALPVQKIIGEMDPDLPVSDVTTMQEAIAHATISSQFDSLLVLAFAVIALLLASAGLYGVVAYLVTQRTAEIGVRIALGARREDVLGLVLKDGLRPALIGLACGLAGSVAAVRLIRSMLYETQPFDPAVFAVVMVTLLAMAMLACIVPAWKASRLDPMQALRTE